MIKYFLTLYWCKDIGTRRFPRLARLPTFAALWGVAILAPVMRHAASLHFLGQILYNFLKLFLKFYSIYTKSFKPPLFIIVSEGVIDFFYYTHLTLFLKREFRVGKHTSPSRKACIPELESIAFGAVKHSFWSRKALLWEWKSIDFRRSKHWL